MNTKYANGCECYILHHKTNGKIIVTIDAEYAECLNQDGEGNYNMSIGIYYNPK